MGHLHTSAFVLVLVPACFLGRDLTMAEPAMGESAILPSVDGGDAAKGGNGSDGSTPTTPEEPGTPDGTPAKGDGGSIGDASKSDPKDAGSTPLRCADGKNDETEPNGLPLVGDSLLVGTFCGSIYRPLDIDVLKFDLGAEGALRIKFDATGDARIVMKGAGQTLEGASGARHDFTSSGPWTITIQSPGGNLQNWIVLRE